MRRVAHLAGLVWSAPVAALGLLLAAAIWALGWRKRWSWSPGLVLEVEVQGPLAEWLRRPRTQPDGDLFWWSGFTVGWTVLYWHEPDERIRLHERRHIQQYRALGVLMPVLYLALLPFGYRRHLLERDADEYASRQLAA